MPKTFGVKLREIRTMRGLSQDELAALLGTTKQVISRYENEQRTPKLDTVQEYADKLNVPLLYLVDNRIEAIPDDNTRSHFSMRLSEAEIKGGVKMGADRRFSVTMPEELYQQFEHFRYANKYSTQTKAAVYLVQRGLDSLREPTPQTDGDVVMTDARAHFLEVRFSQMDDEDKASLYSYAGYLLDQEKYKSGNQQ